MADNSGIAAIQAAAAKKRDAGGEVASKLMGQAPKSGSDSGPRGAAIARRLNKGPSKSGKNDNDGDEQESGY